MIAIIGTTTLEEAMFNVPLRLRHVATNNLAMRLEKLGLFPGAEIVKNDEQVYIQPVRVRGEKGDVILSGNMALKTIVHVGDRKMPVMDMEPGQTGHIEGIVAGSVLGRSLEILGLVENSEVSFIRKLPLMEYVALVVSDAKRVRLLTGLAAKIVGICAGNFKQFAMSPPGERFEVTCLLGGPKSHGALAEKGITQGTILTLESVELSQTIQTCPQDSIVITTRDGLHLHLPLATGRHIFVTRLHGD